MAVKRNRHEKTYGKLSGDTIDEGNRKVTDEERVAFVNLLDGVIGEVLPCSGKILPEGGEMLPEGEGINTQMEATTMNIEWRQDPDQQAEWSLPFPFSSTKVRISGAYKKITKDRQQIPDGLGGTYRSTELDAQFSMMNVSVSDGGDEDLLYKIHDCSTIPAESSFYNKAHYDRLMAILTSLEILQRGKHAKFSERAKAMKLIKEASILEAELFESLNY